MADVKRGNVFLTIRDDEIEKYMAKGFSVVDKNGKVIRESVPTELGQLQKAYSENTETIKKLTAENAQLKAELSKIKAGAKAAPAESTESQGWDDWQEEVDKPAKKPKKTRS